MKMQCIIMLKTSHCVLHYIETEKKTILENGTRFNI